MQATQRSREGQPGGSGGLGRAMRYIGRYPGLTAGAIGALLLATAAQLAVPQLIQRMIDTIVVTTGQQETLELSGSQPDLLGQLGVAAADLELQIENAPQAIWIAAVIVIVLAFARGIFAFAQAYGSQALSQNIAFELRNDLFEKIQRLSFSYHDKNRTGQLMIRATDDVERLRIFIGQGLLIAIQAVLLLTVTITILFFTNARLAWVVIPILPLAILAFGVFGAVARPLFQANQQKLSAVNNVLQENLAGLRLIKASASELYEQERFKTRIDDLLGQGVRINRVFAVLFPITFGIGSLGQAAVFYFGGRQIISGTLTIGELQTFILYLLYIFLPLGQLGFIISLMAQAAASATRIFEILDAKNDVENKPGAIELAQITGRVAFQDVTFRYFSASDNVLEDLNFTAEPGETIALLGSTGSGKTTIINLIPRFYDASEGQILIDGHDVRDVTIDSLRQKIGIVLQETTLFSGSIRENIAFGRPDASDEEVVAAAKAAAAHEFIISFPEGYDTAVGERGSTLSGGQKQRIAIARALLLNPQILILDDSTSSVDLNTEYKIQQALDRLMEGRTSFVIAQRITTVLNADKILVLDKGRIVDIGKHEELMEKSAIYAEIYHSQLATDAEMQEEGIANV